MFVRLYKNAWSLAVAASALLALSACNKEFEDYTIPQETAQMPSAGTLIQGNANYSILRAAITKAGLQDVLSNNRARYTIFAPDDAAFIASGLPLAVVNSSAVPASQLQSILSYHIIPQSLPSAQIPTTFPNIQMPSLLALPGTNPLLKMNIFPSRRGTTLFANNIPVTEADIAIGNGVMHKVARVVAPPQQLVAQLLGADPELSFFRAAIKRGDVGQTGLNMLDSVTRFGVANITVFAPNNTAFRQLLTAMGLPAEEASIGLLPVATARGIVAYHFLGSRAFGVNLPATTSTIQTLVGAAPLPQLTVDRSTAAPRLLGAGNRGVYANFTATDLHGINGVVHKIDGVLLPQ